MSKKVTVYNVETGDSVEVCGIDAREYVRNGGWSTAAPAPAEDVPDETAPAEEKQTKKPAKDKK